MADVGLGKVERTIACVVESGGDYRDILTAALTRAGVAEVHFHDDVQRAHETGIHADVWVFGESPGPPPWDTLADIRHNRLGGNPFVTIICVIAAANQAAAREAIAAGADDVVARPINEGQLVQRLRRALLQRAPFVVSSDYIGPERRARDRGLTVGRIVVPNTFVEKASGRASDPAALRAMISLGIGDLLRARLDAHGYRLGWLANIADPDLLPLACDILSDAAALSVKLKELALSVLCGSLCTAVRQGAPLREHGSPWGAIAIAAACLRLGIPAELAVTDAAHGATAYRQRSRAAFHPIRKIGSFSAGPSESFPTIEIRCANRGERLFEQGDAADAGYLIVRGSVSLFRRRQDQQVPLAKLRAGEVFGEMMVMDGSPRRASAAVSDDAVLCVLRPADLGQGGGLLSTYLLMLGESLRRVQEAYTPKSRHISDSVQQMIEQVAAIGDYIRSPSAPKGLGADAAAIATRLGELTGALIDLISTRPELDRRMRALPDGTERAASAETDPR